MLEDLSGNERLLLLEFLCAFAWTDLEIREGERRFIERVMDKLDLTPDEQMQVEQWFLVAPAPASVSPDRVPVAHRRDFIETVRALIYSDGNVDAEEREQFEKFKQALSR